MNKDKQLIESDIFKPDIKLLIKLGSIITHYEEWTSKSGHELDKTTIDSLMQEPDIKQWFEEMRKMALLPLKR